MVEFEKINLLSTWKAIAVSVITHVLDLSYWFHPPLSLSVRQWAYTSPNIYIAHHLQTYCRGMDRIWSDPPLLWFKHIFQKLRVWISSIKELLRDEDFLLAVVLAWKSWELRNWEVHDSHKCIPTDIVGVKSSWPATKMPRFSQWIPTTVPEIGIHYQWESSGVDPGSICWWDEKWELNKKFTEVWGQRSWIFFFFCDIS